MKITGGKIFSILSIHWMATKINILKPTGQDIAGCTGAGLGIFMSISRWKKRGFILCALSFHGNPSVISSPPSWDHPG